MNIIENLNFIGQDERVRKFLLPVRVVQTTGQVADAEKLLQRKSLQIGHNEKNRTILENGSSGENASVLLDFGIEMNGSVRLMIADTKCGGYAQVRITFGESAAEANSRIGEKNAGNDHAARRFTVPVQPLSDQEWGQTGFRFVKIELLSKNARVEFKSILAVFVYREYEYKGGFSCSDEMLNRIYDTAVYTCHLNMQNMVWDGIKRDRLVWIGDMMPETMTIRDVFGCVPLVEQSLEFVRDQTPLPGWMCGGFHSYSMWWVIILWDWYMASGSAAFLERNRTYALELLNNLCDLVAEDGSDRVTFYFFDWPTYQTPAAVSGVRTLLKMALSCGVTLCEYYGEQLLAARCSQCRETLELKQDDDYGYKQVAAFLAMSGSLDAESAGKRIVEGGTRGFSTFLLYFMLHIAAESGRHEEALQLLKEYYSEMLRCGATSFWEDFSTDWLKAEDTVTELPQPGQHDIHGDCGAFCYKGFRHSLCHGWAAGAVPYITEHILGVTILEPGCTKLKIHPQLARLEWAHGTFPTPFGTVEIDHRSQPDGTIISKIQAPEGVEIELVGALRG